MEKYEEAEKESTERAQELLRMRYDAFPKLCFSLLQFEKHFPQRKAISGRQLKYPF